MKNKNFVMALGLTAVVAIIIAVVFMNIPDNSAVTVLNQTKTSSSSVNIGGEFTLTDSRGKSVTDKDYRGKYMLVFFGYTFCPDVCPTALQTISDTMDLMGPIAKKIQPLFVTVDPARDTVDVLNRYVKNFHPAIIGLTGTDRQIANIAKIYGVFYAKSIEPGAEDDDYAMAHSAIVYLMGPDGKYLANFRHETPPDEMAARLKTYLK